MKLEIQIMQQEAAVFLLKKYVASKRANQNDLINAERRLAELKDLREKPVVNSIPKPAMNIGPILQVHVPKTEPSPQPSLSTKNLRAEIWSQIDKKKRELAEVCNSMHDVPKDADCPELMIEALTIKAEEEKLWTKFRYLERNGKLPDEPEPEQKQNSLELLQAMDEKRKLGEKRTKLAAKIKSPLNKKHRKMEEWIHDYEMAILELQRLDDNIYLMKNR